MQYTYNIRCRSYCIRTRRITYVHVRIRSYVERICTYLTSKDPYVGLTGVVCECISNEYVQILTPCWGHRLYVYERISTYLCRNTCIYVQYVFMQKYVHMHTVTVLSRLLCVHRRRRKSLHFRRAVATASLSRDSASACRSPNSIISGLRD